MKNLDFKWLLVSGGRNYSFTDLDRQALNYIFIRDSYSGIMSGGARGADECAEKWARNNAVPFIVFPADWDNYDRGAGAIRNETMSEYAHGAMFFPGGKGTEHMLKRAYEKHMTIYIASEIKTELISMRR
jgi:hypothetical protein